MQTQHQEAISHHAEVAQEMSARIKAVEADLLSEQGKVEQLQARYVASEAAKTAAEEVLHIYRGNVDQEKRK